MSPNALRRLFSRRESHRWSAGAAVLLTGCLALWPGFAAAQTDSAASDSEEIIRASTYTIYPGGIKYDQPFAHLDYVNPDAPKGGEISIWASGTFDSMNPFTRKGRPGRLSSIMYERIMTSTDDDAYGYYCLMCTELEYPKSEDWVIFHLRDDIKFSDGTPMTAHDIVFTIDLFLEQGLPSYREAVRKLYKNYEALDDHTIRFDFADGIPRKALIVQAGASIAFSKAWFDETGAGLDESRLETPPGTGPYMIDNYDVNRRIVYKRNPDYWGKDLPINVGRFNFDSIKVEYFADENAALEGFKAGVYTFRVESSPKIWSTAYDFPAVEKGQVIKEELPNGNLPAATGFVFNLRQDKFKDRKVREALSLMYNFTWTNSELQYSLYEQRESFWQNSPMQAQGVPEGAELAVLKAVSDNLDPAILTNSAQIAHTSGAQPLDRRNVRRAQQLLREAGFETGDGGKWVKDGKTLDVEFLVPSSSVETARVAEPYIQNLQQLGVNARLTKVDPAQYTQRTQEKYDYDMIYDGYSNGLSEALGISQRYGCEDAEYSVFNPAGYCSEAVDALIRAVVDATTLEEMQTALTAIDRILRHEIFMVPVWYNPNYWVAYWDQYRHPDPLPPYDLGYLDFWWYDAEAASALRAAGALR